MTNVYLTAFQDLGLRHKYLQGLFLQRGEIEPGYQVDSTINEAFLHAYRFYFSYFEHLCPNLNFL